MPGELRRRTAAHLTATHQGAPTSSDRFMVPAMCRARQVQERLDPQNPCFGCAFRDKGCRSACYLVDKVLPKADPLIFDEIQTAPDILLGAHEINRRGDRHVPLALGRHRGRRAPHILERAIKSSLTEKQQRVAIEASRWKE